MLDRISRLLHIQLVKVSLFPFCAATAPSVRQFAARGKVWTPAFFVGHFEYRGHLHCNAFAPLFPVTIAQGALELAHIPDPVKYYRVEKMKFGGKRPNADKTTVIYNANITMTGIPLEAYEYVVNGKPALEWVMERQCVKTDKASGILNDANAYANETLGDPAYPFLLFQRVITVSLETMKIVRNLPRLDID